MTNDIYVDANKLYGWAVSRSLIAKHKLSCWVSFYDWLMRKQKTVNLSSHEYILEIDLEDHEQLHIKVISYW